MSLLLPDISHYENVQSFHDIANAGCPAVIMKCTEGTGYTDPTYADYKARTKACGMVAGAYVFLDPAQATPQVQHFLSAAHLSSGDLQPIVDAEKLGLTKGEFTAAMYDLEGRAYKPICYANYYFWRDTLGSPSRWPLWLAGYTQTMHTLAKNVRLFAWQFTDKGQVPGITNPVDCSHFYGTVSDLKGYCIP